MIAVAVDAILVLVGLEAVALGMLHRFTGRGPGLATLGANLLAGFLLMVALRLALGEAEVSPARAAMIAAVLAGALLAHVLDLAARWRS